MPSQKLYSSIVKNFSGGKEKVFWNSKFISETSVTDPIYTYFWYTKAFQMNSQNQKEKR
jgi:hypothetical protein